MTRRLLALAALSVAAIAACPGCRDEPQKTLSVYMYSEYIDPDLLAEFEARTGVKVQLSVYETTEEMQAKLELAPDQYDVVVVSDHAVPVMAEKGLLQPLDLARIPNAANVAEKFVKPPYDPQGRFSLPYQWGTVGLAYRTDKVTAPKPSWGMVLDPAGQPGPVALMDSMRDMMAAALAYRGHPINSTDPDHLRQAGEAIAQAKTERVIAFESGIGGLKKVMAGDALVAIVYNGDAIREGDPNVGFVLPREGAVVWVDAMVVPAKARHVEHAHRWIDFILDAGIGARLSNFNRYATPNKASLPKIDQADRDNPAIYPADEQMRTLDYLIDVGPAGRLYDEIWTKVKAR